MPLYRVTIMQHTIREKYLEAASAEDARTLAEAEDWRGWRVVDSDAAGEWIDAITPAAPFDGTVAPKAGTPDIPASSLDQHDAAILQTED